MMEGCIIPSILDKKRGAEMQEHVDVWISFFFLFFLDEWNSPCELLSPKGPYSLFHPMLVPCYHYFNAIFLGKFLWKISFHPSGMCLGAVPCS